MNPQEIAKVIVDAGAGISALALIGFGVYCFIKFLERLGELSVRFVDNHMKHIQNDTARAANNSDKMIELTLVMQRSLDAQSQMLGLIVEQTKK